MWPPFLFAKSYAEAVSNAAPSHTETPAELRKFPMQGLN
jgi:hypothetical protein